MKKQSIIIIAVIVFVLSAAIGYALFSQTLTVSGTARAQGSFDIEFTSIGTVESNGYTKQVTDPVHELVVISEDKKTLTVTVNKLDYPGSYVQIPVTITNSGLISAKLKNIEQTGLDTDAGPIKVSYSGIAASDTAIESGDTQNMVIRVEWLSDNNETADAATFTITLNYEQAS